MHLGEIVALDTPRALLAGLGDELLELRIEGDVEAARAALGVEGADVVGQTLTVPLHDTSVGDAIAAIERAGVVTTAISSRQPTLDDVYLRLTGRAVAV
jgi:ABC-2 type transport system ATP-binding protein